MSYKINMGQWNSVFAVPVSVVDKHIKLANETHLKVLLYLLRNSDFDNTDETLAEALNISADEASNAVRFWIDRELLQSNGCELSPPINSETVVVASEKTISKTDETAKKPRTVPSRAQKPDPAFVSKLLKEDAILAGFLEDTQRALKKPLSNGDISTLVMLYDTYGLPCDVIAMLITHLSETGDANMRSIERIGLRWADEGIKTAEDAVIEIERMQNSREAWGSVSSLLGIRNVGHPTKSQTEHAYRWLYVWNFNDEMITEAYERCVNTKGEYNIRYINAILQKWNEKNIKSLDVLHKYEEKSKKSGKSKKARSEKGSVFSIDGASFDITKFENDSLFDD